MAVLDKGFALVRKGEAWYAAKIRDRQSGEVAFRLTDRDTRDAKGQAEQVTDLAELARRVLLEGKKMRCAPERGKASSLYRHSAGVRHYRLDERIAEQLGIAPEGPTA